MKDRQTVKLSITPGTFFSIVIVTSIFVYVAASLINYIPVKTNDAAYHKTDRNFVDEAKNISQIYDTDMSVSKIRHLLIYIDGLCDYYDIDYDMVKQIIAAESSWKYKARSHTNDRGLMQISRGVAIDHKTAHASCDDPYTSVTIGIKHLARLKNEVGNFPSKILYAYHHGLSASNKVSLAYATGDKYVTRVQSMKLH